MLMDRRGANLRGALYIVLAILGAILADAWLREVLPRWAVSLCGILAAALGAWRMFIDNSIAQSQMPTPGPTESVQPTLESEETN